jgi:hypothetical protein
MKKKTLVWKIYKFLFLDFWHRKFFNSEIKPQEEDFSDDKLIEEYFKELNLKVFGFDVIKKEKVAFKKQSNPTIFYVNHPSSLDALFVFYFLKRIDPIFISFAHNSLFFKFLESRTIPVAARQRSKVNDLLGMKLKLAAVLEDFDKEQSKTNNKLVVGKAVKQLAAGRSIVIFPSGGFGDWKDGIGFIIGQYYDENPTKDLFLQPLKMTSFGEAKSVYHGMLHTLGIKIKSVVKIKVLPETSLSELNKLNFFKEKDKKKRAKAIKKYLEDNYKKF